VQQDWLVPELSEIMRCGNDEFLKFRIVLHTLVTCPQLKLTNLNNKIVQICQF
jgi:hypothetical protein